MSSVDVFEVIAEPNRRAILDLLAERTRTVNELVQAFPHLSQPGVSRHLRILREQELVKVRPVAQQRVYELRADRLTEIEVWLSRYRRFWPKHLDALEAHLARTHSSESGESENE